nr:hypothetical protein [Tanacetum cinerariifolium]
MDNPYLTMEEYIEPEAEKAHFENEFPTIVNNDALTSGPEILSDPTISPLNDDRIDFRISLEESDDEDYIVMYDNDSFSYKLIFVNDLKTVSENSIYEVNIPHNDVVIEQLDNDINYNVVYKDGVFAIELQRPRYKVEGYTEEIVHDFEGRLDTIFSRQVNRVHIIDFERLTKEVREALIGLHTEEEMAGDGFEAYWVGSLREIANKDDLSDY